MNNNLTTNSEIVNRQSGAALVMVLFISILLGIACVALLSSVGANSRNSTDVLSETKAYYAAESGLQATINILRNNSSATYSAAIASPADLSNLGLTYDCTTSVSIGPNACTPQGTSYSILVSDPDNSMTTTTFSTVGTFTANGTGTISFPDATNPDVTLTFENVTNCVISFTNSTNCNGTTNAKLSSIRIDKYGSTTLIPSTGVKFSIDYFIVTPRPAKKTITGKISQDASSPNNITVTFDSPVYTLLGTDVNLCQTSTTDPCSGGNQTISNPADGSVTNASFYMHTTPVEPYRLKVLSTGYGPNGAKKQLEGIIQKNFFNDYSSPAAITMQGTGSGLVFSWTGGGTSSIIGENGGTSIGVVDPTGLSTVTTTVDGLNNATINPAPSVAGDVPDWLATPQNLDAILNQLKVTAQNSGRYFSPATTSPTQIGNLTNGVPDGTGITFYDGNYNPGNIDGGGILIVKGNLITNGGWDFKGLLIVTGSEGWSRGGGGGGQITGGVIIAPYTSADLVSNTWSLPPKYAKSGGGTSDIQYDALDLNIAFDGTSSISNFMLGIVEK